VGVVTYSLVIDFVEDDTDEDEDDLRVFIIFDIIQVVVVVRVGEASEVENAVVNSIFATQVVYRQF
jgi:hypothetical protein